MLEINNHGPLITATNYWGSELDRAGTLYLSVNAGAFRLLLPSGWESALDEMRTGREAIVTRGMLRGGDAVELLFDDGTASPYAIHLGASQCDRLPIPEDDGRADLVFTAWTAPRRGVAPHKALERPARYRVVADLPCLRPWE